MQGVPITTKISPKIAACRIGAASGCRKLSAPAQISQAFGLTH